MRGFALLYIALLHVALGFAIWRIYQREPRLDANAVPTGVGLHNVGVDSSESNSTGPEIWKGNEGIFGPLGKLEENAVLAKRVRIVFSNGKESLQPDQFAAVILGQLNQVNQTTNAWEDPVIRIIRGGLGVIDFVDRNASEVVRMEFDSNWKVIKVERGRLGVPIQFLYDNALHGVNIEGDSHKADPRGEPK